MQIEFQPEFENISLTKEWIANHEKKLAKMMIKDPWSDPVFKKNGLYEMYIIDAIGEIIDLPIEIENDLNPEYTTLKELIESVLNSESKKDFFALLDFIQGYLKTKIKLKHWINRNEVNMDIRLLDSVEDCMSWLYERLKV